MTMQEKMTARNTKNKPGKQKEKVEKGYFLHTSYL